MVNFNGVIIENHAALTNLNRGFLYGDALFETVRIIDGRVLFLEDHYFRLMASMRILRMEIAMNFTMEFFESQFLSLSGEQGFGSARGRMTVWRNDGGRYLPTDRNASFLVSVEPLQTAEYVFSTEPYEVDLYKDFFVSSQLLSTLKSTNRNINVLAAVFAEENALDNCVLLNGGKNVVEAVNGNLFAVSGNRLLTPPLSDGCTNGIMRKQILNLARKRGLEVVEESLSTFDLQRVDELFITNVIAGVQPVTKYRKKEYRTDVSKKLSDALNVFAGLSSATDFPEHLTK